MKFEVIAQCTTSKARASVLHLVHASVNTPVFMPVGTQGTLKGLTPTQLKETSCVMALGNTYHLANRPGPEILKEMGGLHSFMGWDKGLLTDSGGFQMVSLLQLSEMAEEGVKFRSPHDGSEMLLTPEKSIEMQNIIGADVIMQLDDVVSSTLTGPRVEEAMYRSIRWLDRCIKAHSRPHDQNLFAIIQGGLDPNLRKICIEEMVKRDTPGYAIGGLSGGEEKDKFWRTVSLCTDLLPKEKPRYCMGVGFAVDLVVCSALGADMFDCVFPTRTARFGTALVPWGNMHLKNSQFAKDFTPIDPNCQCFTCKTYTRAYLHSIVNKETISCHLLSIHNVTYQMTLMKGIRDSIINDRFPQYVRKFLFDLYGQKDKVPVWVTEALASVNITLEEN